MLTTIEASKYQGTQTIQRQIIDKPDQPLFSNVNTLPMCQVIPNSAFIRASISENIANPSEELLNPIQLLHNLLGSRYVKMVIRNCRVWLPVRQIKRGNGWVPPCFNFLPNNLPIIFISPIRVPPRFCHLQRGISPQLPQVLLPPLLWIFREIEQVLVELVLAVLLFLFPFQPTAV
ncbi:hypothetical protein CFOL_v3_05319 [Cephalotus follicularis]|uniref:Uncharacterized protein n=1 Tax=Cephalotus follicularis TaxID=3775 RepID=A0A1Q3B1V3_CEPFO|nr:hypothetical protein CFOL_v3_05319 [Cephalotus follicularis]